MADLPDLDDYLEPVALQYAGNSGGSTMEDYTIPLSTAISLRRIADSLQPVISGTPSREQKLVDIMFQIAIMVHCDERFTKRGHMEVAEYVRSQLKECGFEVEPAGMSHGVLRHS